MARDVEVSHDHVRGHEERGAKALQRHRGGLWLDAANGTPLWNARLGNVTNAPQTYMLDGKQHVLVAAGDQLYAFRLN